MMMHDRQKDRAGEHEPPEAERPQSYALVPAGRSDTLLDRADLASVAGAELCQRATRRRCSGALIQRRHIPGGGATAACSSIAATSATSATSSLVCNEPS